MKRISLPWTSVFAFTTGGNKKFHPATPWLLAANVYKLQAIWELISAQSNLSVTFAYQIANVDNTPGNVYEVGSALTSDGVSYGVMTDVSSNTGSQRLVRFGWYVTNTSAATLILGRCGGVVHYDANL